MEKIRLAWVKINLKMKMNMNMNSWTWLLNNLENNVEMSEHEIELDHEHEPKLFLQQMWKA